MNQVKANIKEEKHYLFYWEQTTKSDTLMLKLPWNGFTGFITLLFKSLVA